MPVTTKGQTTFMAGIRGILVAIVTFFPHPENAISATTRPAVIPTEILRVAVAIIAFLAPVHDPIPTKWLGRWVDGGRTVPGASAWGAGGKNEHNEEQAGHGRKASGRAGWAPTWDHCTALSSAHCNQT